MKEEAIKKINKIGKISHVFALIAKIVVGMGLALMLVVTILCFFAPEELLKIDISDKVDMSWDISSLGSDLSEEEIEEMKKEIEESVTVDGEEIQPENVEVTSDSFKLGSEMEMYSFTLREMTWLMLALSVNIIMMMVTLCFVSALCKAFRDCESPFEENVVKKMSNLAYSLLPWAVISSLANSVADSFMNNKLSLNLTVDLGVIIIVFVVFVLVYIFKYGAILQQESDETL